LERSLGTLLSCGLSFEQILDMSFDQIGLASRAAMRHKLSMIEMVMDPVASAFGAKKPPKTRKSNKGVSKEQKKAELLAKLSKVYGNVPVVNG